MLIDANLLIYAVDERVPPHARAVAWLEEQLSGAGRVGLPWESLTAFLRVVTHPAALARPMSPDAAWAVVDRWLSSPAVWTPGPTDRHGEVLGGLIRRYHLTAKLIPDAHLAALAIQHGIPIYSADTDFARFDEIRWINPVQP